MSVDVRTRSDAELESIETASFFATTLPAALRRVAEHGLPETQRPLRPLLLEVGGTPWSLLLVDGCPVVEPGPAALAADRHAHVRLTTEQLQDLAIDLVTPIGLLTSNTLDQPVGQIGHLLDWWLVLRAGLDHDVLVSPHQVVLPEQLDRHFTLADDPAEIRSFLEQTGFAHLRGVFTADEMAQVSADMDRAAPTYTQGDGNSWWSGLADGTDRLVRMQGFEHHSPTASALLEDDRFLALGRIPGCDHQFGGFADSKLEALFKPIGVVSGISDIPWHKDCSLGRHSYECCRITVGISVTGAGPTTGQLRVIAGSHRARIWPSLLDVTTLGLPDLPLATETGDVTLHLSCTLHMAQPPTTAERRVLYTSFILPPVDPEATLAAHHKLVATTRETAPLTVSQPAASPR